MKIDELINKLKEIKEEHGNLEVCRENPYPFNIHDTELKLINVNVYNDIGVFQDFKYVYLKFERDNINGSWKQNKDNSLTFTVEYNHEVNRKNLILKFRDFIQLLNEEKI